MKTYSFLFLLFFALIHTSYAQTVSKSQLLGKWKASGMEVKGKHLSLESKASLKRDFLAMQPGPHSAADSALISTSADLIFSILGDLNFEFRNNDKVYTRMTMTMQGKTNSITDTASYTLAGDKLSMSKGSEKIESITLSMPDPRTMVFRDFSVAQGRILIFRKE